MGSVVTLVLPLPPIEASPNHRVATRGGRMKQNAAVQNYKAAVVAVMRSKKPKDGWPEGPIVLTYHWFNGRRRLVGRKRALKDGLCRPKDRDNAIGCAKPIQDAMQLAGLLPDGDAAGRVRVDDVQIFNRQETHGGAMQVIVVATTDTEAKDADANTVGGSR